MMDAVLKNYFMSSAKLRFDMFLEKKKREGFFLFSELTYIRTRRYVMYVKSQFCRSLFYFNKGGSE
jgi:hypothetical protein